MHLSRERPVPSSSYFRRPLPQSTLGSLRSLIYFRAFSPLQSLFTGFSNLLLLVSQNKTVFPMVKRACQYSTGTLSIQIFFCFPSI